MGVTLCADAVAISDDVIIYVYKSMAIKNDNQYYLA